MGLTLRLGNDGLGSGNGPWDAQFCGAEEDLGSLLSTCAEAVGWSYRCLAQLADFNSCLAQVAVKFGRDESILLFATTITRKFAHAGFNG